MHLDRKMLLFRFENQKPSIRDFFPQLYIQVSWIFPIQCQIQIFLKLRLSCNILLRIRNRRDWVWQSKPWRQRAKEGNVQFHFYAFLFFHCVLFFYIIFLTYLLDVLLQLVIWWPILQGRQRGRQLRGMRLLPLIHLRSLCRVCLTCVLQRGLLCLRSYLHLRYCVVRFPFFTHSSFCFQTA